MTKNEHKWASQVKSDTLVGFKNNKIKRKGMHSRNGEIWQLPIKADISNSLGMRSGWQD